MHALHRPLLPRAIAITTIAALLAIVLTLAIASGLSDRESVAGPATAPSVATATQVPATHARPSASPFTRSPFSSLLTVPVRPPWDLTGAD